MDLESLSDEDLRRAMVVSAHGLKDRILFMLNVAETDGEAEKAIGEDRLSVQSPVQISGGEDEYRREFTMLMRLLDEMERRLGD